MTITLKIPASREGSAVLIVLILVILISVLVVTNAVILRHLDREIDLIEKRQIQHSPRPAMEEVGQKSI